MLIIFRPCSSVASAAEGEAIGAINHHVLSAVVSIQDDVHQCHHVGYGDCTVTVDVGFLDDEIVVAYAENMVNYQCHIGHGDCSVAVHIAQVGAYLEVGAEGVDGHLGVGPVEHIGGTEVEHLVVDGSNIQGIISADEGHVATIRCEANGGGGIDGHVVEHGVDDNDICIVNLGNGLAITHFPSAAEQGYEITARSGGER